MTSARSTKIDLNATPFYHCMSRCVRRSFLCGVDKETGVDYSHRKHLIVQRIKQLADIFAIQICSYAVLSNHYHLVLFINENFAHSWNDEEVIARWEMLHPIDASKYKDLELHNPFLKEKILEWRSRLVSISWFMKCLNETIAKICNKEDDCKGHFWEGRFQSQALLDEAAVIAAMAYVDLNPIRAKITDTPETSEFTSIFDRINTLRTNNSTQPSHLMPFIDSNYPIDEMAPTIDLPLSDYLELVDSTGRLLREDKRGAIPESLPPILQRLKLSANGWLNMVQNLQSHFFTGIGEVSILCEYRAQYRTQSPKGLSAAKQYYLQAA